MCGRYSLADFEPFTDRHPWILSALDPVPRYNVAPMTDIVIATNHEPYELQFAHWGLVPHWAKDVSVGNRMINARAETLAEKSAYRDAVRKRRCLIVADGFYEWRKEADGTKTPIHFRLKGGEPFAFAGLWSLWHDREDAPPLVSCTMITTKPNALVAQVHDRMPVMLKDDEPMKRWLDPAPRDYEEVSPLLAPMDPDVMESWPVGKAVSRPGNEGPQLIEKIAPPTLFG